MFQDATCRIVMFSPYLILCAAPDTALSSSGVAGVRRGLEQLSKSCDQMGYLVLHDPPFRVSMPPEVRTGLTIALQRFEDRIAAEALVYEESGFRATAIRGLVSASQVTSRSKYPAKVFAETRAALEWIVSLLPDSKVGIGELSEFVREQRKRLHSRTPVAAPPSSRR